MANAEHLVEPRDVPDVIPLQEVLPSLDLSEVNPKHLVELGLRDLSRQPKRGWREGDFLVPPHAEVVLRLVLNAVEVRDHATRPVAISLRLFAFNGSRSGVNSRCTTSQVFHHRFSAGADLEFGIDAPQVSPNSFITDADIQCDFLVE
jgi:hypothetical protein